MWQRVEGRLADNDQENIFYSFYCHINGRLGSNGGESACEG